MGDVPSLIKEKDKKGRETAMEKAAKDYLKEPYSRVLIPDNETYFAEILEFPGCYAEGKTPGEAYKNLEKAAESWIEAALEQGQEIPLPQETHEFSGRIALRIPRSLHKQAAKFAEREGTSLNQFLLSAIAARLGAEDFCERLIKKLKVKTYVTTSNWCEYQYNFSGGYEFVRTSEEDLKNATFIWLGKSSPTK
jgi:antitoxin HicB